ncbi:MAG: hypothetical protein Faunusvirus23_10 [Faunusvirus sp.]|uniref:Uncharacterized protein n=1 Tax=Faunusvirus sp. TaxID=2487766 RepID=A0A3G5A138_9VIRU|nr:MAG: hypothetical protein Faunusvirus23_10 [Faunusvirus sp.]
MTTIFIPIYVVTIYELVFRTDPFCAHCDISQLSSVGIITYHTFLEIPVIELYLMFVILNIYYIIRSLYSGDNDINHVELISYMIPIISLHNYIFILLNIYTTTPLIELYTSSPLFRFMITVHMVYICRKIIFKCLSLLTGPMKIYVKRSDGGRMFMIDI